MKESIALALLLLAALVLIPLIVMGTGEKGLPNPFDTAQEQTVSKKDGQSQEERKTAELDPNAQARGALDDLLTQYSRPEGDDTAGQETFRILNITTQEVETVSVRDYVIGAVASEMPASFAQEALKAQAVAAHTYALRRKQNEAVSPTPELKGADFEADPSNFKGYMTEELARVWYGENFDVYWSRIVNACEQVLGQVLVYDGQPIIAAYHSMSAGLTESAETVWQTGVPYLVPVKSEGDELARNFEVETDVTADEVKGLLTAKYAAIKLPKDKAKWFAVQSRSESGTVTGLNAGDITMTGQEARAMFELRSANFTVTYADGKFSFVTLGYGHGVGLSQYGADYMARQGVDYKEILAHYYTGAVLSDVSALSDETESE